MKPIRIQRKRTKGWKMPDNTLYVGRPTKWGNPFYIGKPDAKKGIIYACENNQQAVNCYKEAIDWGVLKFLQEDLHELKGKNLSCFCSLDKPCHADILLKLANEEV